MKHHPAADAFPMMDNKRFSELLEDIKLNGQRLPIIVSEGMILDGRNRYKACVQLSIQPRTEEYAGNPWEYVWSLNGCRRDLVDEQRYLIWKHCNDQSEAWLIEKNRIFNEGNKRKAEAAQQRPRTEEGTFKQKPQTEQSVPRVDSHPTKQAKAAASKTNPGAVARGDKLASHRPDLAEKVRKGELRPSEAHRQMKKDEVSTKVAALPANKYRVIYADPPWKYGDSKDGYCDSVGGTALATGASHHYPTMSISDLCALPVAEMAADDAVLFLWTTSPLLFECAPLISAWGFKYKASFIWDKVKHNMGHYNSVRHELLLICTKGSCTPDNSKLFDSVQSIERTEHSAKPDEFRKIIDTLYPKGKRIELFARKAAEGWERWGNEA